MTDGHYPMRFRITAEAGVTRVDVYDDVGEGGWFSDGLTAKAFASKMASVSGPLDVHINSYGGDVGDGIAIGSTIRDHRGFKRTVVDGFAASIASVIAQAGDERIMQPGSMMMIHDALSGAFGVNADQARELADNLDKHSDNIATIYARRAGGTPEHWRDVMRRKDTWYTAEEAVAAGLADRVGDGMAALPAGFDLAAFTAVPGRIAARLRVMPQAAAAPHGPVTGTHPHPAYGAQGAGSMHEHEHTHDGGASHSHTHGESAQERAARLRAAATAEEHGHPGQECWDPDGDGDCDLTPEGDTDHDYWAPDGTQLKPVPSAPGDALDARIRAVIREEITAALDARVVNGPLPVHHTATSDKPFDGPEYETYVQGDPDAVKAKMRAYAAWVDPDGDPGTKAAYKLGHHDISPDGHVGAANMNGVRAGLAELGGARGGVNIPEADKAGVRAHLEAHLRDGGGHPGGEDHAHPDLSGIDLGQLRDGLKGAFA